METFFLFCSPSAAQAERQTALWSGALPIFS